MIQLDLFPSDPGPVLFRVCFACRIVRIPLEVTVCERCRGHARLDTVPRAGRP